MKSIIFILLGQQFLGEKSFDVKKDLLMVTETTTRKEKYEIVLRVEASV